MKYVENRLYPLRFHSRYYLLTALRESLLDIISNYLGNNFSEATLVDLGCGDMPYRPLFKGIVSRYIGVDIEKNQAADLNFDENGKSPLIEDCADIVLSTQVLEHVQKPELYLMECNRVVKVGGFLILSSHGFWPYHPDPHDYWRWTWEGLYKQVEEAGFTIIYFSGIIGIGSLCFQFLQDIIVNQIPYSLRYLKYCIAAFFQIVIQFADRLSSKEKKNKNAWVFILVAKKMSSIDK